MSRAHAGPLDAAAVLAWMQAHPDRLRELLAEEDALDADTQAAADSAVRAHLRFAAEALPVGLRPDLAARVEGMADDLDAWFEADREVLEREVELGRGAIALEEHLLYGAGADTEPVIHAALERRVRLGAWNRLFLRCLESRLGPGHDGLAEAALQWSKDNERDLAAVILQVHHRQITALEAATGHPATADERDQSSQAAAVTGYARRAVEAAAHALQDA
ncbi:MAG: hypothetical protein ACPHP1_04145 [Miltoncostaeaceae bacterium]